MADNALSAIRCMRNGDPDSPNADDSARRAYNIFVVVSDFIVISVLSQDP